MSEWRVLRDGATSAAAQMALDERLAREAALTVRLFQWSAAACSSGWKQPLPAWAVVAPQHGVEWVERPTGGGIALHGSDVSVAIVIPQVVETNLCRIMQAVCRSAVRLCAAHGLEAAALIDAPRSGRITYCLAQESPYAVMVQGKKLAGFALRRFRTSWLIQGSLLVRPLPHVLWEALPPDVTDQLRARAVSMADAGLPGITEAEIADRWSTCWDEWWEAAGAELVAAGA